MVGTYLVAFSAMLFAAFSALALVRAFSHFDPPEPVQSPAAVEQHAAA